MMNYENLVKSNLHTHTRFCDGAHTPEEIVQSAIESGMDTIGFSGHSFTPIDTSYCMTEEGTEEYIKEIDRLRELYGDRINILCGIEMDLYGKRPTHVFDYVIGGVHYVQLDGEYCTVDHTLELQERAILEHCASNPYRYVREYFENVAKLPDALTPCDVVAHFDLVTKYIDRKPLFDVNDPRYLTPALEALEYLIQRDMIIEVNTGAISRGYRTSPYPTATLLHFSAQKGGRVTLGADAHRKEHLMTFFPRALFLLRTAGFFEVQCMTRAGWTPISIC